MREPTHRLAPGEPPVHPLAPRSGDRPTPAVLPSAAHDFASLSIYPSPHHGPVPIQRSAEDDADPWWQSIIEAISGLGAQRAAGQQPHVPPPAPVATPVVQQLDPWPIDLGPVPNRPGVRPAQPPSPPPGPAAGAYGSVDRHVDHPNALRDNSNPNLPLRQRPRLSEDEHLMARQSMEALEFDPATSQTRFTQADYNDSPSMRTPYQGMATVKTHGNQGGPNADNPRGARLMDQAQNGGEVQYLRDVLGPSLDQQTLARDRAVSNNVPGAADITDARIATEVLAQDAFNWERWAGRHDREFSSAPPTGQTVSGELAARGETILADTDYDWDRTFETTPAAEPAGPTAAEPSAVAAAESTGPAAAASGPNYGHAALMGGLGAGGMSLAHSLLADGDLSTSDLETAGLAAGQGTLTGVANEALAARFGGGMAGNMKAGALVDAVTSGAFSTWDNAARFRAGAEDGSQATSNVLVDTTVGVGTGLASMWAGGAAGAEIGALVGSVVPGLGNLVGGAAGFLIGAGTGYLANALLDASGATSWLKEQGADLLHAVGADEVLDTAWTGIADGTEWLGDQASAAWDGISDAGAAIGDFAGDAWDWLTG